MLLHGCPLKQPFCEMSVNGWEVLVLLIPVALKTAKAVGLVLRPSVVSCQHEIQTYWQPVGQLASALFQSAMELHRSRPDYLQLAETPQDWRSHWITDLDFDHVSARTKLSVCFVGLSKGTLQCQLDYHRLPVPTFLSIFQSPLTERLRSPHLKNEHWFSVQWHDLVRCDTLEFVESSGLFD